MENEIETNLSDKKPSNRKHKLTVGLLLIFIISALILSWFNQAGKSDPASEKIIREAAAKQLGKDPNELTDEDFAKVTELEFRHLNLHDVMLLKKFTNLKKLDISQNGIPKTNNPLWKTLLSKIHLVDLKKRAVVDLQPIKNLTKLERLSLNQSLVKNIEAVSNLSNLEQISISWNDITNLESLKDLTNLYALVVVGNKVTDIKPLQDMTKMMFLQIASNQISDIEPLRNMTELKRLDLSDNPISNLEPLRNLAQIERLDIDETLITDIEPLSGLKNLSELRISMTDVSNLKPLEGLNNLKHLNIRGCNNISFQQEQDLRKALPNLSISRSIPGW